MNTRNVAFLAASLALGLVGCDDSSPGTDDAGSIEVDSGLLSDAGPSFDAGPSLDAGATTDAAIPGDAGVVADAAMETDARVPPTGCVGTLATDLCFLREEEKLARDVYITLFASSGIRVFENISRSEQMHTDAVRDLLLSRSIPDPVSDDTVGVFVDPFLAGLYTDLTTAGSADDVAALNVGATIEDLDIRDIRDMTARTTDVEATALYDSLACGSRNHMRSFIGQLESRGETYVPVYITAEEFTAILDGPRERCP